MGAGERVAGLGVGKLLDSFDIVSRPEAEKMDFNCAVKSLDNEQKQNLFFVGPTVLSFFLPLKQ